MFIVLWIIVGFLAGLLTGKLMKGNTFGSVRDTLTGIAGAMIGGFIMRGWGFLLRRDHSTQSSSPFSVGCF